MNELNENSKPIEFETIGEVRNNERFIKLLAKVLMIADEINQKNEVDNQDKTE